MSTDATVPPPPRCSDVARARCEPLGATAAHYDVWLLIEHPGPWQHSAWQGLDVPAPLRQRIDGALAGVTGRVQLVRRHGRQSGPAIGAVGDASSWRWAVVDTRPGASGPRTTWGTWGVLADLEAVVPVLEGLRRGGAGDRPAPVAGAGPDQAAALEESVLLVCCHARHDQCCAVRGRPVAAELVRHWPGIVLETTHLGGDRFAANLLVLPDGVLYGGLDPTLAPEVVARHFGLEGPAAAVDTAHLRGFTTADRHGQAALIAVHETEGGLPPRALRVAGRRAAEGGGQIVTVTEVADPRRAWTVEVTTSEQPAAQLTCKALDDTRSLTLRGTVRASPVDA